VGVAPVQPAPARKVGGRDRLDAIHHFAGRSGGRRRSRRRFQWHQLRRSCPLPFNISFLFFCGSAWIAVVNIIACSNAVVASSRQRAVPRGGGDGRSAHHSHPPHGSHQPSLHRPIASSVAIITAARQSSPFEGVGAVVLRRHTSPPTESALSGVVSKFRNRPSRRLAVVRVNESKIPNISTTTKE
jgi:hypothetical protein